MKQTTKRVLSLLMALTMLIGMMTAVSVSATEDVVEFTVTVKVGKGGTVTCGDDTLSGSKKTYTVEKGTDIILTVAPESGKYADVREANPAKQGTQAGIDGTKMPVVNNQAVLENVSADSEIRVVFTEVGWENLLYADFDAIGGLHSAGVIRNDYDTTTEPSNFVTDSETNSTVYKNTMTANKTSSTKFVMLQGLTPKAGVTYRVSMDAKASRNKDEDGNHIALVGYDSANLKYWMANDGVYPELSTSWQRISHEMTYVSDGSAFAYQVQQRYHTGAKQNILEGDVVYLDNIVVEKKSVPVAPVVEGDVTISGAAQLGQTLTANAVVTDANTSDTATASYQWQVKIDGDWKDIAEATAKTYVIGETAMVDGSQVDMLGKQVRVKVTPTSNYEPMTGTPKESDATQAITEASVAPSGTGEQMVATSFEVGQEVTASFEYIPSVSDVAKGDAEYIWETSESEEFTEATEVQRGTNDKYTIKIADVGKWLRVRIIPKDLNGLAGEELVVDATKVTGVVSFYVSIDEGDDNNDGSLNEPFKTIEKARDTIRAVREELNGELPIGGIIVNIMGGTYPVSDTIAFAAQDSGTEGRPIVYQAYNNEKVSFIGGKTLDSSKIQKVTDEEVLDGLVEEDAKDHLYMLDLGEQGVEMDALQPYGNGYSRNTLERKVKRIYMNNQLLTEARWPNDDQSQNLLVATPVTEHDDVKAGKYNGEKTPIMYGYPDPENRSAKWNIKEGDAFVGGAVVYYWAQTFLRIKSIDAEKKIVTSLDNSSYGSVAGAGWGVQSKIFFSNIFAEIDKPGESYVDRENNILYFYPIGQIEDAEMVISTLKKNIISLNGVSHVTFKGIDFKNTVETAIKMNNCDNVTIAGAEISNITQCGIEMTNCTNTIIEENNFYNIGARGIHLTGNPESRKTLTASGNEIRYNNFHHVNIFPDYKDAAIFMTTAVGEWIHHNEFNDIDIFTIKMEYCNDTLIEYNKLINLGELSSDGGAIYWGREVSSLGHTIRYNYFENIGSKLVSNHLAGHQSVSVFTDDASTGGNIYGNVFLNGGSNTKGNGTATIGNGPEFTNIWGNISICTDFDKMSGSYSMRNWNDADGLKLYGATVPTGTAASSWLFHMQMRKAFGKDNSSKASQSERELMWLDAWKVRYAETPWAAALEHYSKENYEGAKALFDQEDYAGVLTFLGNNLTHERTNKIHDNVSLGAIIMNSLADHYQNYNGTQHQITEEDKALFVDFDNKDFTLTDAGLAKIKATAPEFEAIPFNEIGLGNKAVGGHKPVVTVKPEIINGVAKAGYNITAAYTFTDEDGDLEGDTKIYWYVSETEDGKYDMIYGGDNSKKSEFGGVEGKKFEVLEDYTGKYLKYEIVPADMTALRGETVWSDPIFVSAAGAADVTELSDKITAALALVNNAVAGEEIGQYPQSEIDKLSALIVEAQAMANNPDAYQYQVNAMLEKLTVGVQVFESSIVSKSEFMSIAELLEDESGWTQGKGSDATLEDGVMTVPVNNTIAYTADKFDNQIFVFKMKIEDANKEDDIVPVVDGVSIAFRKSIWENAWTYTKDTYLWWIKNDQNEAQFCSKIPETNADNSYTDVFTNNLIELDTEYTIGVGAYDVAGEGVKWVLYIDDMTEPVFERTYSKAEDQGIMNGKDGYFMLGNQGENIVAKFYAVEPADVTELNTSIENAKALLEKAGDGYGEYPASYIESLEAAIAKAEALAENSGAVQKDVDATLESLNTLINSAKLNANTQMDVTEDGEITIDYDLPEATFNVDSSVTDVTLQMDPEKEQPAYVFTYEGDDGTVTTEIPKDATLSADDWDGSFDLPILGTTPSEDLSGENFTVLTMGEPGKVIESSEIVKIVLPGMAGKSLAYLQDNGSYKVISKNKNLEENTLEAAEAELANGGVVKVNDGDDMVIYTTYLTELVAYDWRASSTTPSTTPSTSPTTRPTGTPGEPTGGQPIVGPGSSISGNSGNTTSSTKPAEGEFTDTIGHWAEDDINQMADKGVVSGVTATTFEPDRSITRAEFAALITRALKLSAANNDGVFKDVPTDAWYADEVAAAAASGLIVGYNGNFRPDDTITREEMAVVIMKAYKFLGKSPLNGKIDQFADKDSISAWAVEYVDQAVSSGLISGMTANTFAPSENATRAQVTSLIKRLLDK